LTYCKGLSVSDVVPNSSQTATELSVLQNKLQAMNGQLGEIEEKINNLVDNAENTSNEVYRKALEHRAASHLIERSKLEQEKRDVHSRIDTLLGNGKNIEEQLKSIRELIDKMKELEGQKRIDLRLNLRSQLRRLIKTINIDAEKEAFKIMFQSGQIRWIRLKVEGRYRIWDAYPKRIFKGVKPK